MVTFQSFQNGAQNSIKKPDSFIVSTVKHLNHLFPKFLTGSVVFKRQKFRKIDLKNSSQFCQNQSGNIGFTSFHFSKILAADSGLFRQLILRQSSLRSQFLNSFT